VFRVFTICFVFLFASACRENSPQKAIQSGAGATITRIVSTAPNLTEIVFALGAGDKLVGVTRYCNYPEAARKLTRVGGYMDPSVEKMVALKPNLVLLTKRGASTTLESALARYRIPALSLPLDTMDDVRRSFTVVGKAIGELSAGVALTERFNAQIEKQKARIPKNATRPKTVVIIGHRPLIVAGKGAFIGDLLLLAGGENAAQSSLQPYPQWSAETLLREKPDVIIDAWMGGPDEIADTAPERWRTMEGIPAVLNQRVHRVSDERLLRPGPRLTEALATLVTLLYPGAKP